MTAEQWEQIKSVLGQALEQPAATRVSWIHSHCPEDSIRAEVLSLLESHVDDTEDFLERPPDAHDALIPSLRSGSMIGERIGPWLLVEEVGQGGMGTVYRAVREEEFHRQAAIKIVSRGMDTEMLLQRFRTERQILANLEHPYIARLIDGGSTSSGLPYFVMEFVHGIPLTTYCDQNRLGISERIELFRKVCSAVAYAHNNLIVHRDLKPANILVTKHGDPKLLDFGIARLLGGPGNDSSDRTVTILRMATPAYASPEQIRGAVAGIPSDIYSLGVILYELLTGHRPYRLPSRDAADLARIICEHEPTRASVVISASESFEKSDGDITVVDPPSVCEERGTTLDQLRKKLRGDLDNIISMALRKEPHRRYDTVDQLSDDLRRHLAGLPITARKDTIGYRAAKFFDRHRWSVSAGIAALLLLIVMSLLALRDAARLAHRVEEDHKLATSFLVDIHDSIARLPGAAQARETLLQQSLRYLNGLSADSGDAPENLRALALAYEKFAELQIGRNGPGIGKSSDARNTYEHARTIREAIVARHPADAAYRLELAENYVLGGYIAGRTATVDVRRGFDQKALDIAEKLIREDPRNPDYRRVLAGAHTSLAYGLINEERWELARIELRKAMAILSEMAAENPEDLAVRQELAAIHYRLGTSFVQARQPVQGEEELKQALEYQQQLAAARPDDGQVRSDIASTCHFLGVALGSQARYSEAVALFDRAVGLRTASLEADPRDSRMRSMLAGNYSERALVLLRAGKAAEALSSAKKAVELQEMVVAKDPRSIPVRISMADFESRLAAVWAVLAEAGQRGAFTEATQWYRRSLEHWDELNREKVLRGPAVQTDIDKLRQTLQKLERRAGV